MSKNDLFLRKSRRLRDNAENMVERFACWIIKAKNTHLAYVIFTALPRHTWLGERA